MGETFFITVHWSPPATPGAPVRGVAQWDLLRVESGTQQQPSARRPPQPARGAEQVEPPPPQTPSHKENTVDELERAIAA